MKALSLKGAWWWWALLHAGKPVENRDWYSGFRGRCVIHISKNASKTEYGEFLALHRELANRDPQLPDVVPGYTELSRLNGKLVGIVNIVACVDHHDSPWFFGKHAFVWKLVEVFPRPIPCTGALGFWNVPEVLVTQINQPQPVTKPKGTQLDFQF